jgi:hypothetical protein
MERWKNVQYRDSEAVGARIHAKPRQARRSGEEGGQARRDAAAEPPPDPQRESADIRQLRDAPDQVPARALLQN